MPESLRELGDLLGIPVDSGGFGAQLAIGQRLSAQLMAPVLAPEDRTSLAAMLARVRSLPSIGLDAQLISGSGQEPVLPVIRVSAQDGLVISTRVHYFSGGREFAPSTDFGGRGGDLTGLPQIPAGQWHLVVRRAGVGPTGFVRLERAFDVVVTPAPPPPPPPPPPRPAVTRPTIAARTENGNQGVMIRVTGSGFLANQPANAHGIAVRLVDTVRFQDQGRYVAGSDGSGALNALVGPVVVGNLQRNAFGQAAIGVSATDSRTDPSSVPAGEPLWSNTVTISF